MTVASDFSGATGNVLCVGVTVISHDSEGRTHVGNIPGCGGAGCYRKDVTYTGVSTAQLAALTLVSQNCEQFIKFECNNDVAFIENSYAWWMSLDGTRMYYWGGATGYIACAAGGIVRLKFGSGAAIQKKEWRRGVWNTISRRFAARGGSAANSHSTGTAAQLPNLTRLVHNTGSCAGYRI